MIKIDYEMYQNDFMRKRGLTKTFDSLESLADWIFNQMKQKYDNQPIVMWFPRKDRIDRILFTPEWRGYRYWIHCIEDSDGIIFSDGATTSGQKFIADCVQKWCAACTERRDKPTFNFVNK